MLLLAPFGRSAAINTLYLYFSLNTLIYLERLFSLIVKCRLVFKLPVGGNLYSSLARLLGDFPATVTPSKLYAHFKFVIN